LTLFFHSIYFCFVPLTIVPFTAFPQEELPLPFFPPDLYLYRVETSEALQRNPLSGFLSFSWFLFFESRPQYQPTSKNVIPSPPRTPHHLPNASGLNLFSCFHYMTFTGTICSSLHQLTPLPFQESEHHRWASFFASPLGFLASASEASAAACVERLVFIHKVTLPFHGRTLSPLFLF